MKTHQRDVQSRPGESEHTRYGMLKEGDFPVLEFLKNYTNPIRSAWRAIGKI